MGAACSFLYGPVHACIIMGNGRDIGKTGVSVTC